MSRIKAVLASTASACALALVLLAAGVPGAALGADQGQPGATGDVVAQAVPGAQDLLPPGLVDNDPGNSGIDLGQILPPRLTEPDPNGGGQKQVAPDTSNPASVTPKPAARAPKRKVPARKSTGARSTRVLGTSPGPASAHKRRRGASTRARPRFPTASHPGHTSVSNQPASNAGPPSPSIVRNVINQIPAEYQVALVGLGLLSLLFAMISLRERRRSRRVERQALVDALTALPNRQAFERRLAKEWRRAERYERNVGVLMLDLDDFKQINDGQGHAAGDHVLSEAAALISGRIRSADMAARWGGDEFVVLCPETNAAGLKVLARSLEDRLRHSGIASSAGFAEREPGDLGPADMLARADVSMYARKQRERARPERRAVTLTDARSSFASLSD